MLLFTLFVTVHRLCPTLCFCFYLYRFYLFRQPHDGAIYFYFTSSTLEGEGDCLYAFGNVIYNYKTVLELFAEVLV